jgi:hypothetical protein
LTETECLDNVGDDRDEPTGRRDHIIADPSRSSEKSDGIGADPSRSPTGGPRRWVVALVIIVAIALFGLIVFLHLSGAIGPGIH